MLVGITYVILTLDNFAQFHTEAFLHFIHTLVTVIFIQIYIRVRGVTNVAAGQCNRPAHRRDCEQIRDNHALYRRSPPNLASAGTAVMTFTISLAFTALKT
jgi:hypothetical protein